MLKVMFDRVLAKEEDMNTMLESGITINEKNLGNIRHAKVVAVGEGSTEYGVFVPMQIDVGDTIYYESHVAIKDKINGEEYVILRQIDVICKEDKGANDEEIFDK